MTENHYCFFCAYPHWAGCSTHHNHDAGDEDDGEACAIRLALTAYKPYEKIMESKYHVFKSLGHTIIARKGAVGYCKEGL